VLECFSCVKICPTQAIEVRGYADFVPMGSNIMPMLGTEDVMWTCNSATADQAVQVPIRTTPEGAANAYENLKARTWKASSVHGRGRKPAAAEAQGTREVGGTVLTNIYRSLTTTF